MNDDHASNDLFWLIAEFSQAETDSERVEIASKLVDAAGEDSSELTDLEVMAAARRIVAAQRAWNA